MDTLKIQLKAAYNKIKSNHYLQVFITFFLVGLLFFIIPAAGNNFTLPLNGDYALQSYAFYVDGYTRMWNFFKTGQYPLFDYSNIFGSNYFGSFTFYYASSPFFLILLLCPFQFIYQGIFLLLVIKYAIGATLFYVLLKKFFHLKDHTSFIGAVAYAFSGWTLYYLWFHFSDVVAVFPLVFMGIELLLQKKKRWLLILSLFLLGITNYFFLVPFGILGAIYALFRFFQIYGRPSKVANYRRGERWGILWQGILCFICGILLAGIVLFPSYLIVLESGRTESTLMIDFLRFFFVDPKQIDGSLDFGKWRSFSEIMSFKYQVTNAKGELIKTVHFNKFFFDFDTSYGSNVKSIPGYVLTEFFIMNFKCIGNAAYDTSLDNAMGGMFITTPLALLMVPALWNSIRKKKVWSIIGFAFCVALPFIPFTYYLLQGFTGLYGRWQLFLVVVAIIYAAHTLDKIEEVNNLTFIVAVIVNVLLTLVGLNMSLKNGTLSMITSDGVTPIADDHLLVYGGQILYMGLACILFISYRDRKWFSKLMTGLVCTEIMISSTITVLGHGYADESTFFGGQDKLKEERKVINYLQENDGSFYRIFNSMATRAYSNLPATLSYNGMSTFNSIYNNNLDPFLDRGKLKYDGSTWSMGYHEKRAYFDEFLGVKYYIINKEDLNNDGFIDNQDIFNGRTNLGIEAQNYALNIPFGYSLYKEFDTFDVYVNDEFIHLGFAYDNYILSSMVGTSREALYYDKLYSSLVIVDNEDSEEIKELYRDDALVASYYQRDVVTTSYSDVNVTLSLREDCSDGICHSVTNEELQKRHRPTYSVTTQDSLTYILSNTYKTNFMRARWNDMNFYGDQLQIVNKENRIVCGDATENNPCYVEVNFKMGPNVMISLYNGDKLLTQDAHMNHNYYIGYREAKSHRGFYVTEPITRSVIEFIGDTDVQLFRINDFNYQYSYYSTFKSSFEKFREYPLLDIEVGMDLYKFKTEYPTKKLLVLNVPYDNGWSLKLNGEATKIYRMQGGFIGIIAPSGIAEYELTYYTPGLTTGIAISILGLLMAAFIGLIYNRKTIRAMLIYAKKNSDDDSFTDSVIDETKDELKKAETIEEMQEIVASVHKMSVEERLNLPFSKQKMDLLLEISRFIIVGLIATIIDLIVYNITKNLFGDLSLKVYIATFIGFTAGLIVSYFLSLLFVFENACKIAKDKTAKTMMAFALTSLIGLGITELGMLLLHGVAGLYDPFVRLFMIGVVLVWNYLSKKLYVFK